MKRRKGKKIRSFMGWILLTAGIFLATSLTLEAHGPKAWKVPAKEKARKNPIASSAESQGRGQKIYLEKCAACHGVNGDGQGETGKSLNPPPPDFTDQHMMKEMSDGEIFWKITTGRDAMPSYQKELNKDERWDLVNYLRSFSRSK